MRNCLKYLFLFWVLLFSTGIAVAQYVTIGTGTANQDKLFHTLYEDARSIATFSNTELTGASLGLNVGDTIYSVGWYVNSLGGQAMYGANIKIRETGSPVTVWSGTLGPTIGWNDVLLDVPYVRQGSGTLIVEYCYDNCEFTSNFLVRRTNVNITNQYDYSDNNNGCSLNGLITHNGRPNIRFGLSVPNTTYVNDAFCINNGIGTPTTLSSSSTLTFNTSISGFTYKGLNNGSYYFLSTSNKTWLEADLICRQNGGHLAHIANATENNYVDNNVINSTSWIGYHQNCNSGVFSEPGDGWEWTDGTLASYTNWNNNEPNNSNGEDYVEMQTTGIWNDHNETRNIKYVLEIEDTYLWNTGATTSSINVNPTVSTTYWVDHTLGTQTTREYFILVNAVGDGCTDPAACNYDAAAVCDDGSCAGLFGCTDVTFCNYDPLATCDDGSCLTAYGCMDVTSCNYDPAATCDDGSCSGSWGCIDPLACNYDPLATCDDGSCTALAGCMDQWACNYNPFSICDDGSCGYDGCTDTLACNYDGSAACDDGSCILPDGCTDPTACNYDASANCDDGSCSGLLGCTDAIVCNYDPLATCDDGSCVSAGTVTIDTTNLQHIACPNGGAVGVATILQSDYTNHSWNNISNGQLYNGGGGNGGLSRNDLDVGFYVVIASDSSECLYSDTFEILEAEPIFNYSPTQSCSSDSNVTVSASMGTAISNVTYTFQWDNNSILSLPNSLVNQWGGSHTYEIFADGIGCGTENIGISQQAPMNLLTTVNNAPTCSQQGSAIVVITGVGSSGLDTYCTSAPQYISYTTIDNVSFVGDNTSISNNTTGICDTYTNYTDTTNFSFADVTPGGTYDLTIDLGSCNPTTAFTDIANVYIDWNIDGIFDAVNELVGQVNPTQSPSTHTLSITVPIGAIPGQSRMRIVAQDVQNQASNQALPCTGQAYFGSTEDYTIQVNGSVAIPVTYLWSDGQITETANNLSAGTYTVIITDANGCTATDTAIITGLVFGCIDPAATNYDSLADCDDGSCTITIVQGCTDSLALNYDSLATIDDSSCIFLSDKVDLFFSEYGEGSSNNKYFEVYNPTNDTVDLSNYAYPMTNNALSNGPGIYEYWRNFSLGSVILPNDVFVVAFSSANPLILAQEDMLVSGSTALSNGDDGMALVYGIEPSLPTTPNNGAYVVLDWVGDWDADPGSGWDVAGVNNATQNHTLVRKCSVTQGNPNSFNSSTGSAGLDSLSSEWIVFNQNYWLDIGEHSYPCPITGCTDSLACNYDSIATIDDGSCTYLVLQSTVVDSTCDSSYAFVNVSIASSTVSSLTYCASSPGSQDFNNIELVRLVGDGDSIVNNTVGLGFPFCDDYEDFTSQYTTLTEGQSYSVEVNTGFCSSLLSGGDSVKVFIDWNIDGDFDDTLEVIGASFSQSSTISFTVPNNGSYGVTRMRVVSHSQFSSSTTPTTVGACDVGSFNPNVHPLYGETEDYSIVIIPSTTLANVTYVWSPIGGANDTTTSLFSGQYIVTVIGDNGCSATDTVSVGQSFQVQLDSLVAVPDPACLGDIVNLTAYPSSALYQYKFMYNDGSGWGGNTITNPVWSANNPVTHIMPITQQTEFRVKVRNSIDNSCVTNWQYIAVPVTIVPTSGPIWHN